MMLHRTVVRRLLSRNVVAVLVHLAWLDSSFVCILDPNVLVVLVVLVVLFTHLFLCFCFVLLYDGIRWIDRWIKSLPHGWQVPIEALK